jgi:hypothetical protein
MAGLHIVFFQVYGYDLKNIAGDLGDSRFIIAITEYNHQWFTGNYDNYWDGFFFFPEKEGISYSDNLLGITPFYSLARLFSGGNVLTAFQLLLVLCHVLNFWACYWTFSKISGNRFGAAAGAFIFAFSIALNGIHNHPQFTFRFCIPLFFYFLYLYLSDKKLKNAIYAALMLLCQFYLGAYLGTFLMVIGGFFALCYLVVNKVNLKDLKRIFIHGVSIGPVIIALMAPLLYFYYRRVKITGFYATYDHFMETVPRFSSYFKSFPGSLLWAGLEKTDVHSIFSWQHYLFPGVIVLVSILAGIYFAFRKDKLYLLLIATITLFLCFTIWYDGHTMYGFMMKIPGIKTARVVTRFITVFIFFAAWLVCLNANKLTQSSSKPWRLIAAMLIAFMIAADNFCFNSGFRTFSKKDCEDRVNLVVDKVKNAPGSHSKEAFAYIPGIKENSHFYHLDAMLAALELKKKTVNGYSSSCNRYYGPVWTNIDSVSVDFWCRHMNYPTDSVLLVK